MDGDRTRARAALDALFRAMHSIKGMAGAMGYTPVEQLAHASETLLAAAREATDVVDGAALDAGFAALCQEAADALARHVDDAVDGRAPRLADAELLRRLEAHALRWNELVATDAEQHEVAGAKPKAPEHSVRAVPPTAPRPTYAPSHTRIVAVSFDADAPLKAVRAQLVLTRLEAIGRVQSIEPPVESISDRFASELAIVVDSTQDDEALEAAVRSAGDINTVGVRGRRERSRGGETMRHVRIDLERLDSLLDLVGELVIARDRLMRAAELSGDRPVHAAALEASRLVSALQEEILQTRMVPVGHVFDRFPRLVRDVSRELGKTITFAMEGRDIALDRSMLDAIGDPIVHLLRNAIDHGLETSAERASAGKPTAGRLVLRALRDRGSIVIAVEDDGRGIDREAVLRRARAEHRIEQDVDSLSDETLVALLAQPGFSTAAAVTSVSGRGVGIDVVANRVRALGGSIEVATELGRGTIFALRLPVTLAIMQALLVRVGDHTYAIPTAHVSEAMELAGLEVTDGGAAGDSVMVRGAAVPLIRLSRPFGASSDASSDAQVVVADAGGRRIACVVDGLLGQQDIVVKPFDAVAGAVPMFSGATILGDGRPALIVDIAALA